MEARELFDWLVSYWGIESWVARAGPYLNAATLKKGGIALAALWALRWIDRRWLVAPRIGFLLRGLVEPSISRYRSSVLAARAEKRGDWLQAGLLYEKKGLFYRALDCYERAEEYHLCGELCYRLGRKDYAAEWFLLGGEKRRAAALLAEAGKHERAAEIYLESGASFEAAGAFAQARRYESAGAIYRQAGHYLKAAQVYEQAGDFLSAAECFERQLHEIGAAGRYLSSAERAEIARWVHRAADCFEKAGERRKAAEVLAAGGQNAEAAAQYEKLEEWRRAAEYYQKAGRMVKAAEMYRRAGDPRTAASLEGEHQLSSGNAEAAAESFLASGDPIRAAEIFENAGQFGRAAECYAEMEAFAPAAEAALKAGDRRRAAEWFERARQPDRAAELYGELGEFARAARLFAEAGRFFDAAKAAAEANCEKSMLEYLQRVGPEDPHYTAAMIELARVFIRRGWSSLAVEKLTVVLAGQPIEPANLELWDVFAEAHEAQGDLVKAVDLLHRMMAVQYTYRDIASRHERLAKRIEEERRRETTLSSVSLALAKTAASSAGGNGARYELGTMLGQGGMGAVYKAYDRWLERPVAYKVLTGRSARDPSARHQLLREARAAAALNHPNIVTVFDLGWRGSEAFISMELLEGETYSSLLKKKVRLSLPEVMHMLVSACQGLDHAHRRGIVHQDLKPSNVMLTVDERVKILDFGLAAPARRSSANQDATVVSGTPKYIAPEQARGEPTDARTDIYSLGASLYELLLGHAPFTEGNLIQHHLYTPPPPLRPERLEVPPAFEELVLSCLAKHPGERFQSAGEILAFATAARLL